MLGSWPRWVIPLIIAVILIAWSVYWVWGQMPKLPIGGETKGERARFLRYLTCSYAMCAQPCDSPKVMALDLEMGEGMTVLGCYDKCSELASDAGVSESEHLCGSDYKLEFVFNDKVIYKANYPSDERLETDASRRNWEGEILEHGTPTYCFDRKNELVTLDGNSYDRGCRWLDFPPKTIGLCEGVLMNSDAWGVASCDWGDRSGNLIPVDRQKEDAALNTGHIWIEPNLESNCEPFEDNRYLGNCTFDEEDPGKVYIWTKVDTIDQEHCPELIICSNPS